MSLLHLKAMFDPLSFYARVLEFGLVCRCCLFLETFGKKADVGVNMLHARVIYSQRCLLRYMLLETYSTLGYLP